MGNYAPKSQQEKDFDEYQLGRQGVQTGSMHNQEGLHDRGGCFPADTKVKTVRGWVPISDISKGDKVIAWTKQGRALACRVKATRRYERRRVLSATLEGGTFLRATRSHTILADDKWVTVDTLKLGDKVAVLNSIGHRTFKSVIDLDSEESVEDVYNLIVKDQYTFVTESCIANSFTTMRTVRTVFHRLIDSIRGASLSKQQSNAGVAQELNP